MGRSTAFAAMFSAVITSTFIHHALAAKPDELPAAALDYPAPKVVPAAAEPAATASKNGLLLRYGAKATPQDQDKVRGLAKAASVKKFAAVPGLEYMQLGKGVSVEKMLDILNRMPFVEYAHPDYILHIDGFPPDDEYFTEQWGLNNTGQASILGAFDPGTPGADIDWLEARDAADGTGVVIAIVDTGIDYRHSDIAGNVWLNEAELNGVDGVDDDGNGYIDDVRGWDFVNEDPYPLDGHGHGTSSAGIIGALTHNTKGIAGIMPNGKVMALKVIGDNGQGLLSDAIEGIQYALDMGVRISNHSWGYTEILPEEVDDHNALFDLMQAAQANDHLFIASAGNAGNDTDISPHYPSSFDLDNVISVGATNNFDELAWFSSYGLTSVDISAPGEWVISTWKVFAGVFDDYAWESGTSLSAPHVAGVAGLVLQLQPDWSYGQIRDRIYDTARVVPALAGKSATGAVVNAGAAVAGLPVTEVSIDVLPGDPANVVYPNKTGKLPVAVLGSASFDATQVDPATLRFAPAQTGIAEAVVVIDVDGLHGPDTVAKFQVADADIQCNDTEVSLTGATYSGDEFAGTDSIDASECEAGGCHAY